MAFTCRVFEQVVSLVEYSLFSPLVCLVLSNALSDPWGSALHVKQLSLQLIDQLKYFVEFAIGYIN